ncbi:metallophosphatase [Alteromonas sp. KUL42]|uniref:ligase-associated DNA damage response endonuclease PdeM n=1 Tax=Alteromonas sp. KUL42 TaxID=2480797 RepID=UPI001036EB5D|nr:ligase-associated DNA damage response endonuclease PdeM [Alteromonas sp. KUL42]TAP33015.1 ligase-associated DNA damage response endonuclease PdeM [Alteromonas sp. KUL42]GEA08609.1 metallophosphatase [Alteromonas sp. KUL42]
MAINDTWLTQQLRQRQLSITKFANHIWLLDARGVAYLPACDWLIVSDLHLEKGSYLRSFGNPLPNIDSTATLLRLERILEDYQPSRVISLGDSFHDRHSMSRMTKHDKSHLSDLVNNTRQWMWVEGNHDPELPAGIPGEPCEEIHLDGIVFRHEPQQNESKAQVIGHFHPKLRTRISRRSYSGKSFVHNATLFIMPAFGQFTGGLNIDDEVMLSLLSKKERNAFMLYDEIIFKV